MWPPWAYGSQLSGPGVSKRYQGRELAVQALVSMDMTRERVSPAAAVAYAASIMAEEEGQPSPESVSFANEIVAGVVSHLGPIDSMIEAAATGSSGRAGWKVTRMDVVVRNILRVGTWELKVSKATPVNIVVNEALRLAESFDHEDAKPFINAVLDRIAKG